MSKTRSHCKEVKGEDLFRLGRNQCKQCDRSKRLNNNKECFHCNQIKNKTMFSKNENVCKECLRNLVQIFPEVSKYSSILFYGTNDEYKYYLSDREEHEMNSILNEHMLKNNGMPNSQFEQLSIIAKRKLKGEII